jgi:hypothetical protein
MTSFLSLGFYQKQLIVKNKWSHDADIEAYTYRIKMYSNNFYIKIFSLGLKFMEMPENCSVLWGVLAFIPSTGVQHNVRFLRETKDFLSSVK